MRLIIEYLRAVLDKWFAMITGGLIAVYLAVQSYVHLPPFSSRIFFSALGSAFAVASFRTWREERIARVAAEQSLESTKNDIVLSEDPKVEIVVHWPNDDVNLRPVNLTARNKGRSKLLNFRIHDLRLGLVSALFSPIAELQSDVDTAIVVTVPNIQADADLLDALMLHYSHEISPIDLPLQAEVEKLNGQMRQLNYKLSYVPLSNPRRTSGALEVFRCLTIRRN